MARKIFPYGKRKRFLDREQLSQVYDYYTLCKQSVRSRVQRLETFFFIIISRLVTLTWVGADEFRSHQTLIAEFAMKNRVLGKKWDVYPFGEHTFGVKFAKNVWD